MQVHLLGRFRIEDHSVFETIFFVTRIHNGVYDQLFIRIRQLRIYAVHRRGEVSQSEIGVAGANRGITGHDAVKVRG